MDKGYEQKYHSIEEYNWWFLARRYTILSMLKDVPKDTRILDIGCSGGVMLKALKANGFTDLTGIDFSPEAIEQCKKNGLTNCFVMDAHYPDFKNETFDLIIASDCMEHLENDKIALQNWNKILKKGGQAIIFVPAFMSIWSEHDVINHHFRRYTKKELVEKSKGAGFKVSKSSYWNCLLFVPTYIFRKIRNRMGDSKEKPKDHLDNFNPVLNNMLKAWLAVENVFFKATGFPVGVSVMVTLKKPE